LESISGKVRRKAGTRIAIVSRSTRTRRLFGVNK
jgi:hypothetical protein